MAINSEMIKISNYPIFMARVMETIADIIYLMNLNTRELLFTSRKIGLTLGYTEEEISEMDNPLLDIMHREDVPVMLQHLEDMKYAKDGEIIEVTYRLKDAAGKLLWFRDRDTIF